MIMRLHAALDDRIYYKEARTLRDAGFDVHLICRLVDGAFTDMGGRAVGRPNPEGKWQYDGMTFHGLYKRGGIIGKVREYQAIVNIGLGINADVYHCHESDIALAAAVSIKKLLPSSKLVYDMHEYWPGAWSSKIRLGLSTLVNIVFKLWELRAFRVCDYVFTANSIVRGYALTQYRYARTAVLLNSPELSIFKDEPSEVFDANELIVCHDGMLTFDRGLREMVSLVRGRRGIVRLKIVGDLRGDEALWFKNECDSNADLAGLVHITGWVDYEEVGNEICTASVGLILFHPTLNNMLAGPPNKLFNYMRYGMPVVSVDLPESRAIILKYRCGIILRDLSYQALSEAIDYLIANPIEAEAMGARGKSALMSELAWSRQGNIMLQAYAEMLNTGSKIIVA
jgi:glycosyltransferase involved in cell wall biosynthesis